MVDEVDALRISVEADTGGFERALNDLSTRANAFGAALTAAFRGAAGGGRSLEGVLRQLGGRIGLMGEAGAEAILPLRRGPDGSLGVAAPGGAQGRTGPSVVFNVTTPDAPSFKRAEVQIQAMLARAAMRGQRGL